MIASKVTDQRLGAIIDKQLELAEKGDRKAAEFVFKMCGGLNPSKLVQNNYYYGPKAGSRKGLRAKTPLGNRIRQYLKKHGPTKPATLAVELEAGLDEIEAELIARPERFRKGPAGWDAL